MKIDDNKMVGRIPNRLVTIANQVCKRKDARENLLKTYAIILYQQLKENKRNKKRNRPTPDHLVYVSISSLYFKKAIAKRYRKYIEILTEAGFVRVKGRELDCFKGGTGLFDDPKRVESYKVGEFAKSYKIVIMPDDNDDFHQFPLNRKFNSIYEKNREFLLSVGVHEPNLTTDNYGFRVYHSLSTSYKEYLPKWGEMINYDFKCSIPTHLKKYIENFLLDNKIENDPFLALFEGDFYENWNTELNLGFEDRNKIKKNFASFLYGKKGDVSPITLDRIKTKFPLFYNLSQNKNLGKIITRIETKFVLGKVVKNLSVKEVLTIHDGFLIHPKDEAKVDQEINNMNLVSEGYILKKSTLS